MFISLDRLYRGLLAMRNNLHAQNVDVDGEWVKVKQDTINSLYYNIVDRNHTFFPTFEDPQVVEQYVIIVNYQYKATIHDIAQAFTVACDSSAYSGNNQTFLMTFEAHLGLNKAPFVPDNTSVLHDYRPF